MDNLPIPIELILIAVGAFALGWSLGRSKGYRQGAADVQNQLDALRHEHNEKSRAARELLGMNDDPS